MTIEFHCNDCGQLLKVPDEAAGRRAQCPKCDATMGIPAQGAAAVATVPAGGPDTLAGKGGQATSPSAVSSQPWAPIKLDVKAALNETVRLFKANLIRSVVGVLIAMCLSLLLPVLISWGLAALGGWLGMPELPAILVMPLVLMAGVWVKIGAIRYFLALVRDEPASIKLLFSGDRGFTAVFSTAIVLAIVCWIGLVLLIVPGVVIGLMLWPSVFLAVDRNLALMQAFRTARMLTKGNIVACLILFVIGYAIIFVSPIAFGIGLLFGMAFSVLLFTVMYNTLVTGGAAQATAG